MTSEEVALSAKAGMRAGTDDDVVEHFNLEKLTSLRQFTRYPNVSFTSGTIS